MTTQMIIALGITIFMIVLIMIDKLPSAGTIRELQNLFKELWKN